LTAHFGRPITKIQHRIAITASFLLAATAINLPRALVGEASAPSAPLAPVSDCVVTVTHRVAPPLLLAGEQAEVSMRIEPYCPLQIEYLNVVFVLPSGSDVPARDRRQIRDDVSVSVDAILARDGSICCGWITQARVGIATYDAAGRADCYLTKDRDRLSRCIDRVMLGRPGNAVEDGLISGSRILFRDRPPDYALREVIVLVANTPRIEGCDALTRTAGPLTKQGIELMTLCTIPTCDDSCLRGFTQPGLGFTQIPALTRRITRRITCDCINISLRQVQWFTTLDPDLRYVEGSSSIPLDPRKADDPLAWSMTFVPKNGLTLTYTVEPAWRGFRRFDLPIQLQWRDNYNRSGMSTSRASLGLGVFDPIRVDP
jgi:hypothetical protein